VYTGNLLVALISTLCVGAVVSFQLGLIGLTGYEVGIVTIVPLMTCPGLAAMHIVRVAEAYIRSPAFNPIDKVREALTRTGMSVLLASVTVMCMCVPLFFSQTAIFVSFGTLLFFTTGYTAFAALILFPTLLLLLGIRGSQCNAYLCILRTRCYLACLLRHHRCRRAVRRQDRVLLRGMAVRTEVLQAEANAAEAMRGKLAQLQQYNAACERAEDRLLVADEAALLREAAARARAAVLTQAATGKAWERYQALEEAGGGGCCGRYQLSCGEVVGARAGSVCCLSWCYAEARERGYLAAYCEEQREAEEGRHKTVDTGGGLDVLREDGPDAMELPEEAEAEHRQEETSDSDSDVWSFTEDSDEDNVAVVNEVEMQTY
jgi:hypothetical protein